MSILLPLREESLRYTSEFKELPSFNEAMVKLLDAISKEEAVDLPENFGNVRMDDQGFLTVQDQKFCYNKHSLSQAIERIKPERVSMAPYICACPPELRAVNFSYWHMQKNWNDKKVVAGSKVMVRTINLDVPVVRAIVSHLYVPADDAVVLDAVADSMGGDHLKNATMAAYRGDKLSRYCIYWPTKKAEVAAGDDLYAALKVVNSEVGASSVKIQPMAYSLSLNAMYAIPRSIEEMAIRHIGEAKGRIDLSIKNATAFITPFMERLSESYDDKWSTYDEFRSDAKVLFKAIGNAHDLPDFLVELALVEYEKVNGSSRAHVAAALSRAAHQTDLDTADLAHDAAGRLVVAGWDYLFQHVEEADA